MEMYQRSLFGRCVKLTLLVVFMILTACSGSGGDSNDFIPGSHKAETGSEVFLAGYLASDTIDPDSILFLEIQWTIVSKPANSQAFIINADTATPTFRPDIAGEYVIRVVVKQGGVVLVENEVSIIAGVDDLFPIKPANHILSTDVCSACHDVTTWLVVSVDHSQVIGICDGCHNNVVATGKSPTHIVTNSACDACHTTTTWGTPVNTVDHTGFSGNCVTCHNGVDASGKSVIHIATTDVCDACHNVFPSVWTPVPVVDHNQVLGSCTSCHNGIIASGKSANHVVTSEDCVACHNTFVWIPADPSASGGGGSVPSPTPGAFDHSMATGSCVSCHNGVNASGKTVNHQLTTDDCNACHTTVSWTPVSLVDHSNVIGLCSSCHNGVTASGKSANHLVTSQDCSACHLTTGWLPALSPGSNSGPLPAKPANHMPTSDLCEACHLKDGWTLGGVDHNQVLGVCEGCHDGVTATGKSATHIVTSLGCDVCHYTVAWIYTGNVPDHSNITGNCISCHNGVDASGKSPTHIATTNACEACHVTYPNNWVPVPVSQVNHAEVIGTCVSCHNSVLATGKSTNHIVSSDACDQCHSTSAWRPAI